MVIEFRPEGAHQWFVGALEAASGERVEVLALGHYVLLGTHLLLLGVTDRVTLQRIRESKVPHLSICADESTYSAMTTYDGSISFLNDYVFLDEMNRLVHRLRLREKERREAEERAQRPLLSSLPPVARKVEFPRGVRWEDIEVRRHPVYIDRFQLRAVGDTFWHEVTFESVGLTQASGPERGQLNRAGRLFCQLLDNAGVFPPSELEKNASALRHWKRELVAALFSAVRADGAPFDDTETGLTTTFAVLTRKG